MFTEATNSFYDDHFKKWKKIDRFLNGTDLAEELEDGTYEDPDRATYRKRNFDFHPLTSNAIQKLIGMLYINESEIEREYESISFDDSIFTHIGPESEDYQLILTRIATNLLAFNSCGIIVKPGETVQVVNPINVPRWMDQEIIIKSKIASPSQDISESEKIIDIWTHYTPDGYDVYSKDDDEEKLLTSREYPTTFLDQNDQPFNPAFRVNLTWDQSLGHELARQHRSIFMLRSSIDTSLQEAINSGSIQIGVDDVLLMDDIIDKIGRKSKYIPYKNKPHKPISIPTGPIEQGMKHLKEKEKSFKQITGQVGNNVQTNSATESVINAKTGVDALLSILGMEMASIEEEILKRMAIIQQPSLTGSMRLKQINVTYPETYVSTS